MIELENDKSYNRILQENEKPLDEWLIAHFGKLILSDKPIRPGCCEQMAVASKAALKFEVTSHNVRRRVKLIRERTQNKTTNHVSMGDKSEIAALEERIKFLEQNCSSLFARHNHLSEQVGKLISDLGAG